MALVKPDIKPDETIIGGGGTTNTSQRGIYIT